MNQWAQVLQRGAHGAALGLLLAAPALPVTAELIFSPGRPNDIYFFPSDYDRWSALPEAERDRYQGLLDRHTGTGCRPSYPVLVNRMVLPEDERYAGIPTSVEHAARLSKSILIGRVTRVDSGFQRGMAGTLLTIDRVRAIESSRQLRDRSYRLFLPVGEARLEGKRFCAATSRFHPVVPAAGDEIVVFLTVLEPEAGLITLSFPEQVILKQGNNPKLFAAGALAEDRAVGEAVSLGALVDAAMAKVAERAGEP